MTNDKEILAQWMIRHEYATGHGDTIEDLLEELKWQIAERSERAALVERFKIKQKHPFLFTADEFEIISNAAIAEGAAAEREACAKVCDRIAIERSDFSPAGVTASECANKIRTRTQAQNDTVSPAELRRRTNAPWNDKASY
jgi:lysophospholipase L1-like esterase